MDTQNFSYPHFGIIKSTLHNYTENTPTKANYFQFGCSQVSDIYFFSIMKSSIFNWVFAMRGDAEK